MGCDQECCSHELLKGGALCDTVEAAGFVSGVLLLERLTQQTPNSRAIKGHVLVTLVWFSFFSSPSFTAVLQTVMLCFAGFLVSSLQLKTWTTKFKAIRANKCLLQSTDTSGSVWNFAGFFCQSCSLQVVQICSCSCTRKADSRYSSQKETEIQCLQIPISNVSFS